ncbi:zinc-ribbon domain-containing protein [Cohnella sp. 56]|uniref:zinc-ribbon domain-containing protein n=1 Tax=Cohnella sp. 56 TaxID=3113722 RepID=UPI0030E90432
MKSVKPGRGPSAMGAAGSVVSVVFGIIWTILAFNLTKNAPFPLISIVFPLFGVVFVVMGIVQAVMHYKNATGRNRMSLFDIVDSDEEPDPYGRRGRDLRQGGGSREPAGIRTDASEHAQQPQGYCPYCGTALRSADYAYCPKCGKELEMKP